MRTKVARAITFGLLASLCKPAAIAQNSTQDSVSQQPSGSCPVDHDQLTDILKKSVKPSGGPTNGGLDNNEWAAVVNRQGMVCAVAFSGANAADQWLGSRAIAAEKANTANALSLKDKAMATANLYAAAQPGGYLFGAALGFGHPKCSGKEDQIAVDLGAGVEGNAVR